MKPPATAPGRAPRREAAPATLRRRRLRAPLLLILATLLAFEAAGGLVLFFARLAWGVAPGETLHVLAGAALALVYAGYQWRHWSRVAPLRRRLDYGLGLLAALSLALALGTGVWLAIPWWRDRIASPTAGPVRYPPPLSALHNIGGMLVLTFAGAHLGAVLMRDRRSRRGD